MKLVTYSPIIVEENRRENNTTLKGKIIEEGFFLSSIAYLTRKEGILRKKITSYITKGGYVSLDELLENLKKELFNVWPWLDDLKIPDINIDNLAKRRVVSFDTEKEELIYESFKNVFIGEVEIGDLGIGKEEALMLSNACRSFTEALATLEWKIIRETIPSLSDFYSELKSSWVKKEKFPLRIGHWTDDPYFGWLFSFWRVNEIRRYLIKHLKKDPYPEKIIYSPKERATFGWVSLV